MAAFLSVYRFWFHLRMGDCRLSQIQAVPPLPARMDINTAHRMWQKAHSKQIPIIHRHGCRQYRQTSPTEHYAALKPVCATFITVMQIAALLLISWMEQNANFREEAISLQAKSKAQQESIEALSAAYAQQRKLTHDFRAHLSTLDGMLMQQNRDINTIQTYIHSLQSKQTERILLVNTHHAALDALLNQKALVAKNRKIDIQFSVNDLSPIKIDMVDLTVVISNTLDNAIEACEKLPETDRQIYVQALLEEDELFYAVRNKSLPVNMVANQLPASTKENPSFHGYGLQNVHTTLEKYHTLYAMDYENGWFEFATELPNTLIS